MLLSIYLLTSCKSQLTLENKEAEALITKALNLPTQHVVSLVNSTNYSTAFDILQQNYILTW